MFQVIKWVIQQTTEIIFPIEKHFIFSKNKNKATYPFNIIPHLKKLHFLLTFSVFTFHSVLLKTVFEA